MCTQSFIYTPARAKLSKEMVKTSIWYYLWSYSHSGKHCFLLRIFCATFQCKMLTCRSLSKQSQTYTQYRCEQWSDPCLNYYYYYFLLIGTGTWRICNWYIKYVHVHHLSYRANPAFNTFNKQNFYTNSYSLFIIKLGVNLWCDSKC